jgi:hypothetical protein
MKTLLFKLSDFADEEMTEGEGDDWDPECSCGGPDVEPLGGNLFRVLGPISLTPFGPLGPELTLGQIIEAEPVSTGVWRYVRTHFKPAVRAWHLVCEQQVLNKRDISQDLQLLRELNCEWEWCVGNITIQTVSMEGEPLLSEVERIVDRLSQKLQPGPIACALEPRAQELWQRHALHKAVKLALSRNLRRICCKRRRDRRARRLHRLPLRHADVHAFSGAPSLAVTLTADRNRVEKPPFSALCQLSPTADITPKMLTAGLCQKHL